MKLQIRKQVFESNSSSTHSLTMCSEADYDSWENGDVYFQGGWRDEKFLTPEEMIDEIVEFIDTKLPELSDYEELPALPKTKEEYYVYIKDNDLDEEFHEFLSSDKDIYTFETFESVHDDYEHFATVHTTPNGEKVVAFGYYGFN